MIIDISKNTGDFQDQIEAFINKLDRELKYTYLTIDRVLASDTVLIKNNAQNEIVAIVGLECWCLLKKAYVVIRRDYQGRNLTKELFAFLIQVIKGKHNIIGSPIHCSNRASIKMVKSLGWKSIGQINDYCYYSYPVNKTGKIYFILLKTIFPLITIVYRTKKYLVKNWRRIY
jgi:hypothetical protein